MIGLEPFAFIYDFFFRLSYKTGLNQRADIRQYIGPPTLEARYAIFLSCIKELARVNFISPPEALLDIKTLQLMRQNGDNELTRLSLRLLEVARYLFDNLYLLLADGAINTG